MNKQILFLFFALCTVPIFGQDQNNQHQYSLGLYAIGYPTKINTNIHTGFLLDISLKKTKHLCSSTSINYSGYFYYFRQIHNISVTSGISWRLEKNNFRFRPGIQIGYLYANQENTTSDYLFHGAFCRASMEITYLLNKIEFGLQSNAGIGYGRTIYYIDIYGGTQEISNRYALLGGFGLELKYNLF